MLTLGDMEWHQSNTLVDFEFLLVILVVEIAFTISRLLSVKGRLLGQVPILSCERWFCIEFSEKRLWLVAA